MASHLIVTVDTNAAENALHTALEQAFADNPAVDVERARLDLGDVRLARADGQVLLLERKAVGDWASSVQGGRYKEQKTRWQRSQESRPEGAPAERFAYLIEGQPLPMVGFLRGMAHKALNAAMLKTELRDGIPVLRSTNAADSAAVCIYLTGEFAKGSLGSAAAQSAARNVAVGLEGGAHKRKRENLEEPTALLAAMLGCVPGMSPAKADAVVRQYPTLSALLAADAGELAQVPCGGRKLGPKVAARLTAL